MTLKSKEISILIVDDDPNILRTTVLILNHHGYAVDSAKDGYEAIEKFQKNPYDVIFLDFNMPHLDGLNVFREIKLIQPDIIVIFITASAENEIHQQMLEEGAINVFEKPVNFIRVLEIIESIQAEKERSRILHQDAQSRDIPSSPSLII